MGHGCVLRTAQHTSVCGTHPSEQQADRLQPRGRYTLAADAENDHFVTLMYQFDLYLACVNHSKIIKNAPRLDPPRIGQSTFNNNNRSAA